MIAAALIGGALFPSAVAGVDGSGIPRVAIIVGPVGAALTPPYLDLAERAAGAAEAEGASVARAYSPNASPERVLEAVSGANIIIYFGHGTGFPNPYSATPDPAKVNGWGLQGPGSRGTHHDSLADGTLAYYGEAWIAANARPAPGFVMIYSNVCYAPGAGEGSHPPSTPDEARARAGGYARTPLAMGASAVFATDFYGGAADLVERLLSSPTLPYGDIIRSDSHYVAAGVTVQPHPYLDGAELWLQRSAYFGAKTDYWFAFSGDPTASFASAGTGRPDALLSSFAQPLTLRLQPGEHFALRLGDDGAVVDEERWTTDAVSRLTVAERRQLAGRGGAWYHITDGEHAGAWIAESPAAYLPGMALEARLDPPRVVEFAAATHAGYRFGSDGMIAEPKVTSLPRASRATADAVSLVDGQLFLHIADGVWADHWLLVSDAVRLAGPVPLPPASAPAAANEPAPPAPPEPPAPSSSASPAPTASLLPSGASSAAPSASVSPSPSAASSSLPAPSDSAAGAGALTPSPSVSPAASASPSPSATPSPSASPSPPASPISSASPSSSDSPSPSASP